MLRSIAVPVLVLASLFHPADAQAPKFVYRDGGDPFGIAMVLHQGALKGAVVYDGGHIAWTDDGATWTQAETPENYRDDLRGVFLLDEDNWYAVGDGGAILHSADLGHVWSWLNETTPILNNAYSQQPAKLYDIHMFSTLSGWAVGEDGTIVSTSNGWQSWTRHLETTHTFSGFDPADAYQMHWFSSSEGVIACDQGYIIKTSNGAASWDFVKSITTPPGPTDACPGTTTLTNEEIWGLSFSGDQGWAVGGYGFNNGVRYLSLDRGDSWTPIGPEEYLPWVSIDPQEACGFPTLYSVTGLGTNQALTVGYGSTVLEYVPGGTSGTVFDVCTCTLPTGATGPIWSQTHPASGATVENGTPPLSRIISLSPSEVWHTGQFGVVRRLDPLTGDWIDQGTSDYNRLLDGDFVSATTGVVIGQLYTIKKTTDGGSSWSVVYSDPAQLTATPANEGTAIDLDAGGYGIALGSAQFVAVSADLGSNWTEIDPWPLNAELGAACIAKSTSIAYTGGPNGAVWKLDLATLSTPPAWIDVSIDDPDADLVTGLVFVDANKGYAVGRNLTAYMTSNGGADWQRVAGAPTGVHFHAVDSWGNGDVAIAVGENGVIYKKATASGNFRPLYTTAPTTQTLYDVQALDAGAQFFAVGELGTVVHGTDTSATLPKSQTSTSLYSCSFDSASHGFLVGRRFGIIEYL